MMNEINELNLEELENVSGGTAPSEGLAYLLLVLAADIEFRYENWLVSNPGASQEQKYQQAKAIAQDIYSKLSGKAKEELDKFMAEDPSKWEKMIKNIVDNN